MFNGLRSASLEFLMDMEAVFVQITWETIFIIMLFKTSIFHKIQSKLSEKDSENARKTF